MYLRYNLNIRKGRAGPYDFSAYLEELLPKLKAFAADRSAMAQGMSRPRPLDATAKTAEAGCS